MQVSDLYFSVDIETDGPIPGPYSMLSFGIVPAGSMRDGRFVRPAQNDGLYLELQPISEEFEPEALAVSGLDRERLKREGLAPAEAMKKASEWIAARCADRHGRSEGDEKNEPVLVAYPLGFDWSFLYWYFIRFTGASPFKHSRAFDIKTGISTRGRRPITKSGHKHLPVHLQSTFPHTHNALDDARSQADIFAKLMEWGGQ